MNPLPKPKGLVQYAILTIAGNKFKFQENIFDTQGTGLWATRQAAEQQLFLEKIKAPTQRYEIYEITWPMEEGALLDATNS